jgi:hypothetical protein
MEPTFASQLQSFGIDASLQTYSQANFGEQKDAGELDAWPATVGMGYASTVHTCWYTFGRETRLTDNWWRAYPESQVEEIPWNDAGRPQTNRPSTWEPYVIEVPPIGDPDGDLMEVHVASRSMEAKFPSSEEQFTENIKLLSWVYNWMMPIFPIANQRGQHFMDTSHWLWPDTDSEEWMGVGVAQYQPENLIAYGSYFQANPDDPESGASVEQ